NVLGGWVERVSPFGGAVFGVLFVLVVAIGFEPTRFRLQKVINRLFSRTDYDRHATLTKLTDALRSLTDMDELAHATLDAIDQMFNPNSLVLSIISDRADGMDVNRYYMASDKIKKRVHHLDEASKTKPHEILFSDREVSSTSPEAIYIGGMQRSPKETLPERLELPMFSHEKVVGLLSMGRKNSGEPYTLTELESLERFAGQAGLAIENLQLIESIFNTNQRLFDAEKLASLGQLASGVAHEIRNPLSSIKMNIQGMARNLQLDEINQKRLRIIQREIDHLDHVVHDVLIYARPSRMEIEPVQPREIIMQTLEVMAPGLQKTNHRVTLNLPPDLPEVKADKDKLHQVIKNLIANAAEAMETDGGLTISSRTSSTHVDLLFNDNGPGISSDVLNSIWNPFFTTKADGTGLGLANVRKFIQEMGGDVEVESSEGEGTSFILTLQKAPKHKVE
ncbi:hypothetical protein KKA00_01070, partial [bacterium]|nr:hypothetical protein [bacterium]